MLHMSTPEKLTPAQLEQLRKRVTPILEKVSGPGLTAWLKSRGLRSSAPKREELTNRVVKLIGDGELKEETLETALIGFEEASGKRIYLFDFVGPDQAANSSLTKRLHALSIPAFGTRKLAGDRPKPMSAIYSHLEHHILRVKWAEQQTKVKLDSQSDEPTSHTFDKRIVFVANLKLGKAELLIDPPENRHSYLDNGRPTAEAYYSAYKTRCADILGIPVEKSNVRGVIEKLVAEEAPRVVRIHIDNHTNQKNLKYGVRGGKGDIRDDPEWRDQYTRFGSTWAWDSQAFHWLAQPSRKRLNRELYSKLDAVEGYLKVNADCSEDEVDYAIGQVRARES